MYVVFVSVSYLSGSLCRDILSSFPDDELCVRPVLLSAADSRAPVIFWGVHFDWKAATSAAFPHRCSPLPLERMKYYARLNLEIERGIVNVEDEQETRFSSKRQRSQSGALLDSDTMDDVDDSSGADSVGADQGECAEVDLTEALEAGGCFRAPHPIGLEQKRQHDQLSDRKAENMIKTGV